jgi:hypothetical protein
MAVKTAITVTMPACRRKLRPPPRAACHACHAVCTRVPMRDAVQCGVVRCGAVRCSVVPGCAEKEEGEEGEACLYTCMHTCVHARVYTHACTPAAKAVRSRMRGIPWTRRSQTSTHIHIYAHIDKLSTCMSIHIPIHLYMHMSYMNVYTHANAHALHACP